MPDTRFFNALREVEHRIVEGFTFLDLEKYIDEAPGLNEEQRSGLWFLALAADNTLETQQLRRHVVIGL